MGTGSSNPAPSSQQMHELQSELRGFRFQIQALEARNKWQQRELTTALEEFEQRLTQAEQRLFYRLHRLDLLYVTFRGACSRSHGPRA